MPTFVTRCKDCGTEFEPGTDAIRAGNWQHCPDCHAAIVGSSAPTPMPESPAPGPVVCPLCKRVLKSGRHRGSCPGRARRRSRDADDRVAA